MVCSRTAQAAYPRTRQAGEQAQKFGRSVLAYQFTAGLLPSLRSKVADAEGSFEQLLVKARFEEAKLRDLSGCSNESKQSTAQVKSNPRVPASGYKKSDDRSVQRCYQCNGVGHYAKNCPLKNRSTTVEAKGRQQQSQSHGGGPAAGNHLTHDPASLIQLPVMLTWSSVMLQHN